MGLGYWPLTNETNCSQLEVRTSRERLYKGAPSKLETVSSAWHVPDAKSHGQTNPSFLMFLLYLPSLTALSPSFHLTPYRYLPFTFFLFLLSFVCVFFPFLSLFIFYLSLICRWFHMFIFFQCRELWLPKLIEHGLTLTKKSGVIVVFFMTNCPSVPSHFAFEKHGAQIKVFFSTCLWEIR